MKLSIIIPYHKETHEQIRPMLRSINEQIGIDFNELEVVLCNDMPNEEAPLDNYEFTEYENLIGRIRKIKSFYTVNPGMSRQTGIDNARGDYVFFCDADDSLYHLGVIRELFDNIDKSKADVYRFPFIEEIGSFDNDLLVYQVKNFNWVWVFAKAYKVEFLRSHGIRFEPRNRWHEDTYFNLLCEYCKPNTIDINSNAYLWKFSRTSITRVNNHEYTFNTIDEYLQAVGFAFDKINNEYKENCAIDILKVVYCYYKTLMNPNNANQPKYNHIAECYYNFVKKFAPILFESIPLNVQQVLAKMKTANDEDFLPELSLQSFLKTLQQKFEKPVEETKQEEVKEESKETKAQKSKK